jgi:hypothetical protein
MVTWVRELGWLEEDGSISAFTVALHAPIHGPDGTWSCFIEFPPFLDKGIAIFGVDALQAITLASAHLAVCLDRCSEDGALVYPDGAPYAPAAPSTPSPQKP